MKKIARFIHVRQRDSENFTEVCSKMIKEYQDEGLEVDIQYSTYFDPDWRNTWYTAIITGKK